MVADMTVGGFRSLLAFWQKLMGSVFKKTALYGVVIATGVITGAGNPALVTSAFAVNRVASVDDTVITTTHLQRRLDLLKVTSGDQATRKIALEQLVEERIKSNAAHARNITVPDAEVEAAFSTIASSNNMRPADLARTLSELGSSKTALIEQLRVGILWRKYVQVSFREQSDKLREQLRAKLFEDTRGKGRTDYDYTLRPMMVYIAPNANAAARKRVAAAISAKINSCDTAASVASQYSDVFTKAVVRRTSVELSPAIAKQLQTLPIGKATRANRIENGYEILVLCNRRELMGQTAPTLAQQNDFANEEIGKYAVRHLEELKKAARVQYH